MGVAARENTKQNAKKCFILNATTSKMLKRFAVFLQTFRFTCNHDLLPLVLLLYHIIIIIIHNYSADKDRPIDL